MARVWCPECEAELEVADEDLGEPMACGVCAASFTARANRRRPRYDEDEEDYDRPRRRRRRERVTAADVEDARRVVAAPAQGLILTGWISAALCLIGGIALAAYGFTNLEDNDPAAQEDAVTAMVFGIGSALLGTPYCVAIAIGGHRMKRLDGTGWVYTSAILGIATVVLCGPCVPITWAAVGVGIWAIVVMNKPEVKDVIEANRRGDRRRRDGYDEGDEDR